VVLLQRLLLFTHQEVLEEILQQDQEEEKEKEKKVKEQRQEHWMI